MDKNNKDDLYYYQGTKTFINLKNIRDREHLEKFEGDNVAIKILKLNINPIKGDYDLQHWQKIHHYLFQDVYSWAGELRKIELFQEYGSPYSKPEKIQDGFNKLVQPVLDKTNYLKNSTKQSVVKDISKLMGELYYIHPFRDGNTRSLTQFTKHIAREAGITIDLSSFVGKRWIEMQHGIVQAAHEQNTSLLEKTLSGCIILTEKHFQDKEKELENFAQELKIQQNYLTNSKESYDTLLKIYTQSKYNQLEKIENKLENFVTVQQDRVKQTFSHRPGVVASLWRGSLWKKEYKHQQNRLQVLQRRLSWVKKIRHDMGGKRLEEMALKKLRKKEPELTSRRDDFVKAQTEQMVTQHMAVRKQQQEKARSQSLGCTRTMDE